MLGEKDKLVVVGCGHWGKNYVRSYCDLLGSDRVVVVDSNVNAVKSQVAQRPGLTGYATFGEALAVGDCSMAVVATPAATHFEIVKQALQAGLDVLAEKPLTLTVAHAKKLVALAEAKKKILMVGHTFLYNPAVSKVHALMKEGVCGDVYYLKATRTHLGLVRSDVNAVWDLAPHDVVIFNHFMGCMPLSVSATGSSFLKKGREDVAFVNVVYPGNVIGNIHVSWADSNKERSIAVVGSRARIVFDDLNALERVKVYEKGIAANVTGGNSFGEFLFALRDGDIISPKVQHAEPLMELCKEFLKCVKDRTMPLASAQNGLDVVRVMCAIEKSLRMGGKKIAI